MKYGDGSEAKHLYAQVDIRKWGVSRRETRLQSLKFKVESRYQDGVTHVRHCRIVAWRETGSERQVEEVEKARRKDCLA